MTTHTPLTRYSATNGALASGFIIAELHQLMGHDPLKFFSGLPAYFRFGYLRTRKAFSYPGSMVRPNTVSSSAIIGADIHIGQGGGLRRI